jgi:hypothetical protein
VLKQLLVALGLTAIMVIVHGAGTLLLVSRIAGREQPTSATPKPLRAAWYIVGMISFLLFLHLVEASVWAICYALGEMLPDFETAAYFSLKSYTTVGYGDVLLPNNWRLLGPIEAGVGILMFGWSTAIIVATLGRLLVVRFPTPADATDSHPKP